ncbi:unnamed protein product [Didymodactylos carnosus]|uniref:RHD domain-containing protein n=1 Tax=Didymodactylos carnosus TaxID=1234261 RepID=A0A814XZN6_9BILA|nr:unnamed protein product [Didymodactylos carnosus]CAF3986018.1 unnamed protein product [Didymodactylos carnosus]
MCHNPNGIPPTEDSFSSLLVPGANFSEMCHNPNTIPPTEDWLSALLVPGANFSEMCHNPNTIPLTEGSFSSLLVPGANFSEMCHNPNTISPTEDVFSSTEDMHDTSEMVISDELKLAQQSLLPIYHTPIPLSTESSIPTFPHDINGEGKNEKIGTIVKEYNQSETLNIQRCKDSSNSITLSTTQPVEPLHFQQIPEIRRSVQVQPNAEMEEHLNPRASNDDIVSATRSSDSNLIVILDQPRSEYHPRTQKESENTAHFIGSNGKYLYPAIKVDRIWQKKGRIYIKVQLIDTTGQPHLYPIKGKLPSRKKVNKEGLIVCSPIGIDENDHAIINNEKENAVYFLVTKTDYDNKFKTFLIEITKPLQDGIIITKDIIHNRHLNISHISFTQCYIDEKSNIICAPETTQISNALVEAYGKVGVEEYAPHYGPCQGGETVILILKGTMKTENLSISITDGKDWNEKIEFKRKGTSVSLIIPEYRTSARAYIYVCYDDDEIARLQYNYCKALNVLLAQLNLDSSTRNEALVNAVCAGKRSHVAIPLTVNQLPFVPSTGIKRQHSTNDYFE